MWVYLWIWMVHDHLLPPWGGQWWRGDPLRFVLNLCLKSPDTKLQGSGLTRRVKEFFEWHWHTWKSLWLSVSWICRPVKLLGQVNSLRFGQCGVWTVGPSGCEAIVWGVGAVGCADREVFLWSVHIHPRQSGPRGLGLRGRLSRQKIRRKPANIWCVSSFSLLPSVFAALTYNLTFRVPHWVSAKISLNLNCYFDLSCLSLCASVNALIFKIRAVLVTVGTEKSHHYSIAFYVVYVLKILPHFFFVVRYT